MEELEGPISFWRKLLVEKGDALTTQVWEKDHAEVDTVIIGAGLTGASCLYWLERNGLTDAVLLEKSCLCNGATGRNGGHQWREIVEQDDEEISIIRADIEAKDVEEVRHLAQDCELFVTGGVSLTFDPSQEPFLRNFSAKTGSVFWDQEQLKSLGHLNGLCGLVFDDAAQFVPGQFVLKLLENVGHKVFTNSGVKQVVNETGRWIVHLESGSTIHCKHVVHATNGYGIDMLPERFHSILTPIRGQCLALNAPFVSLPKNSILFECCEESLEEYLIQRKQDGIIIFGGCRHVAPNKAVNPQHKHAVDETVTNELIKQFQRITGTDDVNIVQQWAGVMCFTPDHHPVVGEIEDNLYISAGYSGHGMVRAYSCGKHIAEKIAKLPTLSRPDIDRAFNPRRFF